MKLQELAEMIAAGDTTADLMEALGQRMVRVPDGWDWENLAGVCECGLLLVPLPRTIRMDRVVVMPVPRPGVRAVDPSATENRPVRVSYEMRHAHLADPDGRARCADCMDDFHPCRDHGAEMCDTPNAEGCMQCANDAALPGEDYCLGCRPYEPDEWDKDRYLGL